MKVLLCSHWFEPSIGGVETVSKILAEEFVKLGAEVTVVTDTPMPDGQLEPAAESRRSFRVLRRLERPALTELGRASDVIFQNLISLQTLLPLVTTRKPVVVAHQSWLRTTEGRRGWQNYLKMLAVRMVTNVSISSAIAADLPVASQVIPNPFEADEFLPYRDTPKRRDVVFVGRLVSDKGCDLLLQAIGLLHSRGKAPRTVTIIGGGPDMPALEAMAAELGIADRVRFLGPMRAGRGPVMAEHRIMVVPSRWKEPFGIVGLEGVASGCAMLASDGGGLPDAVGPCGLLFPNNDLQQLAAQLERLLTEQSLCDQLTARGPAHIERFRPERVAADYMQVFEDAIRRKRGKA